jgi:hypothetical protein
MKKTAAIVIYIAILAVAIWFIVASLVALTRQPAPFSISMLAHSGIFMALFMCTVLMLQLRNALMLSLAMQVCVVGLLWFAAWGTHAFEDVTMVVGAVHIIVAALLGIWNITRIRRNPSNTRA